MIHLDTGFLITALVPGSAQDQALREWLGGGERIAMSTIAWTEFLCGPVQATHIELATTIVSERIPFDDQHANLAATLFNDSGRRRGSLADCMIAATALHAEAQLATNNQNDFRPLRSMGLMLAEV